MSEQTEEEYLIERLSKLLAEISVIVNGPQPMGVLWSYADLPQKVQALKDAAALNAQAQVANDDVAIERAARAIYAECWPEPTDAPFESACASEKKSARLLARAALAAAGVKP